MRGSISPNPRDPIFTTSFLPLGCPKVLSAVPVTYCRGQPALLPELEIGDALAITDAGAYFVPFATSFSFPRPAIVMVDGSNVHLLRRAETFEDIIALDRVEQPLTNEKRQALQ
jgi:hypothetical protein